MSKLLDYVNWRGDLSFDKAPFNVIDAALFSQLTLFKLDNIIPENESRTLEDVFNGYLQYHSFDEKVGFLMTMCQNHIFKAMSQSPRFKELKLSDFERIIDEENICQFEAVTIDLGDELLISYGGTDDSIVGWHEDFQLLYLEEILGHKYARNYLKKICMKYDKQIIICGHSKGANLALETLLSIEDEIYDKIQFVYCFDGPGIGEKIYENSHLEKRLKKAISYLPYHSSIGKLFKHHENIKIVDSSAKFTYQHDIVNWNVDTNDFVYTLNFSDDSNYVDKFIKETLSKMSLEERKELVDEMFDLAYSTDAKTLKDLSERKFKLVKNYLKLPRKKKYFIKKILLKKVFKDKRLRKIILSSFKRN